MKTFCLEDLNDCDLVPCKHCQELFHPLSLNEHLSCENCDCHGEERMSDK